MKIGEPLIKSFDTVALVGDITACNLYWGQVDTIVKEHEPDVFEVEFCDTDGKPYALDTLNAAQLTVLRFQALKFGSLLNRDNSENGEGQALALR